MTKAPASTSKKSGHIYIGVGGWTFAPWRGGVFYPEKLAQAKELSYAASKLTSIEINGTFYSMQRPELFAAWADAVPANDTQTPSVATMESTSRFMMRFSRVISALPPAAAPWLSSPSECNSRTPCGTCGSRS